MPFVTILWGEDPRDQQTDIYDFDTFAERSAFMKGIQVADGWMQWEVLDQDGEDDGASS